jgi:hypothetical protein
MNKKEIEKQLLEEFRGYSQAPMIISRSLELAEKEFKQEISQLMFWNKENEKVLQLTRQQVLELEYKLNEQEKEFIKKIEDSREVLADLEHQQWESWSKYVANDLCKINHLAVIDRWRSNWKPYSELNEKTKDSDRIWADKIIEKLLSQFNSPLKLNPVERTADISKRDKVADADNSNSIELKGGVENEFYNNLS